MCIRDRCRARRCCPESVRSSRARAFCRICPAWRTCSCSGRPPAGLPAMPDSTPLWRSPGSAPTCSARSAPTATACASGWRSPKRCSACPSCSFWTSPPTASTHRRSGRCARSSAGTPPPAPPPVPRSRLLRQKLLVALGLSGIALVLLPTVALLVGWVAFGWAPVRSALGSTLSTPQALLRLAIIVGYLAVVMLFVAALGFLIGVYTDAPLGAVGGAVLLVIVSNILDAVSALGDLRTWLPTHHQYTWTDALAPVVRWDGMLRGAAYSLAYSAVLLLAAWWHFLRKDIVS